MLNLLVLTFYFSYSFAVPTDGKLKFTITEWIYNNDTKFPPMMFKFKDDSVMISCETNDLDAIVSLLRRKSASTPYTSAQEFFKQRVTVVGQTFHISSLSVADGGFYTCNASNSQTNIMLPLGQLIISPSSPDRIPEIFPQTDNNTISIESNGSKNITCKTFGAAGLEESYLNWYKEVDSTLVPVEKSKLSRQQDIYQSQHIDIEILMFKNYKVTDGGKYVCQRKVLDKKPTSAFINIVLEPDRAPTVQLPNLISTFIELKNGQKSFQITCEVSGSPKPIRQWVKDGQVVQNCLDDSNFCHLYLSEISYPANDGIYSCVGTNAVGKANQSVTIQVNVPVILKKLPSTIAASVNDVKLLNCEIQQGNPLPVFQWQVQPNTYDVSKGTYDTAEWTSVSEQYPDGNIPSTFSYIFSENSQASYRCLAKNSFSTDEFTVSVVRTASESPEFTFSPVTEQILINEQDKLYLKCETSLSLYESCTLKKDEQVLEAKKTSGTKLRLLEYEISSVIMSDAGSYECIGTLKKGGAKKLVRSIIVQKLIKPSINNFNDVTILQDEVANTKLTCNSSGNPPPLVTWKHNGVLLSSIPSLQSIEVCKHSTAGIYQSSEMKNELILCQLDYQQHQGSFECTASNKIDSASKTMNLTIKVKPRAVEWKSEVVFGAGSSSELNCVSYANPPANVTWFRVNNKNQSAYLISRMGASQYIVGNAIVEDSGLYMCTAENELGKFEKMVRVIVKGSSGAYIGSMKKETLIAVLVPAIIILLVALTAILFYRRYLKHKYALYLAPDKDFIIDPDRTLFEQSGELPYDMSWEFPRDRLKFIKTLGSGAFGEVWLAEAEGIHDFRPRDLSTAAVKQRKLLRKQTRRYTNFTIRYKKNLNTSKIELEKTMVAVKTLKDDASEAEYKDLATELKILIHLGEHKNIVNLLGACTTKGEKLQVILECCPGGNLLNFLRSKRDIFKNVWFKKEADMENEFTLIDLVLIVYQISKGMDFLQSKKCVHRDLAARNVLVGPDYVMKVADFGLARDIYKNEFYLKETTGLLPVKWMAPESLFDKIYTSSSDVWSYGILLWEVYTLGGSPYPGLPTEELFNFLEEGRRMDCPEICPKSIYEIMLDCWKKSPYDRPLFVQITERLSNILRQNVTSGCEYLVENDLSNGNNYLLPTNVQMKKSSSDYLVADKTSPKKRTYVPEPNQRLLADEEDMSDSALPPVPFSIGDGYVPMNYISPRNFHYAKEARV